MTKNEAETQDAINDLARIGQAVARFMAELHRVGEVVDPNGELDYIAANLRHVVTLKEQRSRRWP